MATRLQGYYAILDVTGTSYNEGALLANAGELLAARPCCLQLRAKQLPLADFCRLGHALRILCTQAEVPLCINDRLDVALAIGADILHLGQGDLPLGEARRILAATPAREMLIGISTHNLEQAREAQAGGADYIGFGPVFPTATKTDADPAVGISALQEVAAAVSLPIVAIGGIGLANIDAVARAGASAAAVIAAVERAPDRAAAGRAIAHAFSKEFIAE
jgi:thiamine-phosphate diphosphorylase